MTKNAIQVQVNQTVELSAIAVVDREQLVQFWAGDVVARDPSSGQLWLVRDGEGICSLAREGRPRRARERKAPRRAHSFPEAVRERQAHAVADVLQEADVPLRAAEVYEAMPRAHQQLFHISDPDSSKRETDAVWWMLRSLLTRGMVDKVRRDGSVYWRWTGPAEHASRTLMASVGGG